MNWHRARALCTGLSWMWIRAGAGALRPGVLKDSRPGGGCGLFKTKDKKMLKILKSGKKDAWIKASGILKKYKEDGKELLYLELKEAKILKTRGKETVKAN